MSIITKDNCFGCNCTITPYSFDMMKGCETDADGKCTPMHYCFECQQARLPVTTDGVVVERGDEVLVIGQRYVFELSDCCVNARLEGVLLGARRRYKGDSSPRLYIGEAGSPLTTWVEGGEATPCGQMRIRQD